MNKKRKRKIKDWCNIIVISLMLIFFIVLSMQVILKTLPQDGQLSYQEFMQMIDKGEVDKVVQVQGSDSMIVYTKDGKSLSVINAKYDEYRKDLLEKGVNIVTQEMTASDAISTIVALLPTLIICGSFLVYIARTMRVGGKHVFSVIENGGNITFKDIAGMENVKEEVEIAVETLVSANKLNSVGARPIKGILLDGQPGCGKTLIAKAIAGEAKVPFISCCGSDFVEMFIGVGASRVRSLWKLAELNAPCVVFIDEIDALGKNRSSQHEESNRTLNALLQKMDGLGSQSGILVIGATNMANEIDPALLRSGRFDKKIHIPTARTNTEREGIIKIHLKNKKVDDTFDTKKVAVMTQGLTGADIENVLNDAVLISLANERYGVISLQDVESAVLKVLTQGVLTNDKYTDQDKQIVAVHEAGHAIVAKALGKKVNRVSIQRYTSGIGGLTQVDQDNDNILKSKEEYNKDIQILLGGLVAETIINKTHTAGCSNDLQRATELAYNMLFNWGMEGTLLVLPFDKLSKKDKQRVNDYIGKQKAVVEKIINCNKDSLVDLVNKLILNEVVYDI